MSRAFEVVGWASGRIVENQFFAGISTEQCGELIEEIGF
jgi:hypothetical protein